MKFAIVGSRGFPSTYSGYETLVRNLGPYLVEAGHAVTVYSREPANGERTWEVQGVRCIATPGIGGKALSTPTYGLTSTVDAALRDFDAALVVNIANGFWLPLLRARGIPTAVNTDGIEWERGKWNRLAKAIFRLGARSAAWHADELICDSHGIDEIWRSTFGRGSTYIPYGAEVSTSTPDDRLAELGLLDRPFLLSVARLVPENNVDLTLDAVEQLNGRELTTVIVGSSVGDSPTAERLRRLADQGRVLWLGHVSDQELLEQLWAHCSVYVHGHSVGGTNPSLLQAMGAGAPALVLDTRFNAEVVANAEQHYPNDPARLAQRIEGLLDDSTARRRLADHGRAQIGERYSWDWVCRRYLAVLEGLARDRAAGRSTRRG